LGFILKGGFMILRLALAAVVVLMIFLFWTGRIPFPKHEVIYSTIGIVVVWGLFILLRYLSVPALWSGVSLFLLVVFFTLCFERKIMKWLKS
jgi:hypothetical protein